MAGVLRCAVARAAGAVVPVWARAAAATVAAAPVGCRAASGAAAAAAALPGNLRVDATVRSWLAAEAAAPEAAEAAPTPAPAAPAAEYVAPVVRLPVHTLTADGSGKLVLGASETVISLEPEVWGVPLAVDIVHRVVVWQEKNGRTTMYKAQDRAEVRGGGKKPWKQKGTGRARHGSTRSPLWRGGGVAHGPVLRDWSVSLPKKIRRLGLRIALSAKARDGRLVVVDSLAAADSGKTRSVAALAAAAAPSGSDAPHAPLVLVDTAIAPPLKAAVLNLPRVKALPSLAANVRDIVRADVLIVTPAAIADLTARLAPDRR